MNEQLSALIDDEIALAEAGHLLAAAQSNKQLTDAWGHYHLIGDAMRGTPAFSADFKQNLMQKIELEATVLSPNAILNNRNESQASATKHKLPPSWSIAASVAAVMVVGWMAVNQPTFSDMGMTNVAAVQAKAVQLKVADEKVTTVAAKDAIPTEYLMAHQASAPSLSSYYIQTVNYAE